MIVLTYLDTYKVERSICYEDFDDFLLAFSSCVTLPDNLSVISLTSNGKEINYQGNVGNLYRTMVNFDRNLL